MNQIENYCLIKIVYKYVTIRDQRISQIAETHAQQEKKNFNNVDIMSTS